MVKVSIISPVYNVEKYIPHFLKSIKNQTIKDYELILVDDGSTDASLKICQTAAAKDKRIQVIHQKNQGSGVARNSGLNVARGKYIYFCDPDDYVDKNLLYDNIDIAEKTGSSVVIFGYYAETANGQVLKTVRPASGVYKSLPEIKKVFPLWFKQPIIYYVWNKLYLHESINDLQFESARTGQDFRFNIKYFSIPRKITCNPKSYYHYLTNRPNSAQNSTQLNKMRNKAQDLAEENTQLVQLFFYCWGEKDNENYISLLSKRMLNTLLLALNSSENLGVKERKEYLNTLINENNINDFIIKKNFSSPKEKYIFFLLRHRNNIILLSLDKCIRNVWRHLN